MLLNKTQNVLLSLLFKNVQVDVHIKHSQSLNNEVSVCTANPDETQTQAQTALKMPETPHLVLFSEKQQLYTELLSND